ncbi:hypothetical protein [Actinokineospora globicatena]|uniref:hypothetical protein n=1 Tax=Actinokineospora globicatena TaxID=103729 RepID=UPI0020A2F56B|nr:hypothetical protein [Actinokineospora globicatena]GLW79669.1 hypothetical protein Aglo01_41500 [Actinokineospora globicatena]GLW85921.1 hypothetical protein Aglo02_35610 [Actinokineospora globicatena]
MTDLDKARIVELLDQASNGLTADYRGKKYEELLKFIFESVPGVFSATNTRNYFGAEQVDIAIGHSGAFRGVPSEFLVECKNYSSPLDSKAVGYFLFICLSRNSSLAVIAAASGLSGDPEDMTYAHSLALAASAMGCRLIIITTKDILGFQSTSDIVDLVSRRWLSAFANGGIGSA